MIGRFPNFGNLVVEISITKLGGGYPLFLDFGVMSLVSVPNLGGGYPIFLKIKIKIWYWVPILGGGYH